LVVVIERIPNFVLMPMAMPANIQRAWAAAFDMED